MTIDKNDPKLTAFVLGELPEDEVKEIQTALEQDTVLQNEIEAIRQTVTAIEAALKDEPLKDEPAVGGGNKSPLAAKAEQRSKSFSPLKMILAASLLLAVCGSVFYAGMFYAGNLMREKFVGGITAELAKVAKTECTADFVGGIISGGRLSNESSSNERSTKDKPYEVYREVPQSSPEMPMRNPFGVYGALGTSDGKEPAGMESGTKREEAEVNGYNGQTSVLSGKGIISSDRSKISGSGSLNKQGSGTLELSDNTSGYGGRTSVMSSSAARSAAPGRPAEKSVMMMVEPRIIIQENEITAGTSEGKPLAPDDSFNKEKNETYKNTEENPFKVVKTGEFSTFSIDVDTASYGTMRRCIQSGQKVPEDSVRLEEYINYFKYDYAVPVDGKPFAVHTDLAQCPWQPKHLLCKIGLKGKEYSTDERPPLNLVFLIDTSGSMSASNRLPLVIRSLTELVEMLQGKDRIAIVTYAGSSKVALPGVSGNEKQAILDSLNGLNAGGSTAGAAGIKTAYETARKYYNKNGQNRVILCTDGDFNVGETDNSKLETMIAKEAKSGVFLTILGFGMGNYKDERLKILSMKGNGNYGYIDTPEEARKLLVEGLTGTLFAIAKDVKIQVDFNPAKVAGYRLIGYENRKLRDEDFNNDRVDAGEIGAGHTVTALYEIVPAGVNVPQALDKPRYSAKEPEGKQSETDKEKSGGTNSAADNSDELLFVKLRYKEPKEDKSNLLEVPVKAADVSGRSAKDESGRLGGFDFAAGVALFGMLLRHSQYSGDGTFGMVLQLCEKNINDDKYRREFIELVKKAKEL